MKSVVGQREKCVIFNACFSNAKRLTEGNKQTLSLQLYTTNDDIFLH